MYLSRVRPAPGFMVSQLTHRASVGDAYAQHQFLWQLFSENSDRDFLFRYEHGKEGVSYYVLSSMAPKEVDGLEVASKVFAPKLKVGDCLAYNLRANPTKMLKAKVKGGKGQRVDVMMHAKHLAREEQTEKGAIEALQMKAAQDWLMDTGRQERLGLEYITTPEVTEHIQHAVRKGSAKSTQQTIKFSSVNYEGLLKVVNPDRFVEQLRQGVGRSKSMGCGLMLIRPAG